MFRGRGRGGGMGGGPKWLNVNPAAELRDKTITKVEGNNFSRAFIMDDGTTYQVNTSKQTKERFTSDDGDEYPSFEFEINGDDDFDVLINQTIQTAEFFTFPETGLRLQTYGASIFEIKCKYCDDHYDSDGYDPSNSREEYVDLILVKKNFWELVM